MKKSLGLVFAFLAMSATAAHALVVAPAVPEPASWALMMTGVAAIGVVLRLRKRLAASN